MAIYGPYIAIYGPYMVHLCPYMGHMCPYMVHIWPYMGHIWTIYGHILFVYVHLLTICGHICPYMVHICPYMAHINGYILATYGLYMAIYAHIWTRIWTIYGSVDCGRRPYWIWDQTTIYAWHVWHKYLLLNKPLQRCRPHAQCCDTSIRVVGVTRMMAKNLAKFWP